MAENEDDVVALESKLAQLEARLHAQVLDAVSSPSRNVKRRYVPSVPPRFTNAVKLLEEEKKRKKEEEQEKVNQWWSQEVHQITEHHSAFIAVGPSTSADCQTPPRQIAATVIPTVSPPTQPRRLCLDDEGRLPPSAVAELLGFGSTPPCIDDCPTPSGVSPARPVRAALEKRDLDRKQECARMASLCGGPSLLGVSKDMVARLFLQEALPASEKITEMREQQQPAESSVTHALTDDLQRFLTRHPKDAHEVSCCVVDTAREYIQRVGQYRVQGGMQNCFNLCGNAETSDRKAIAEHMEGAMDSIRNGDTSTSSAAGAAIRRELLLAVRSQT